MKKIFILALIFLFSACTVNSPNTEDNAVPKGQPVRTAVSDATAAPTTTPTAVSTASPTEKPKTEKTIVSFSTPLKDNSSGRVHNVKLALGKLNGRHIKKGEIFSFNGIIGSTGKQDGYKKAIIYVNGKRRNGYGGGICQVSSTLYNAAMETGMEIVERHAHNGPPVGYVPQGKDATVAYGSKDFKFKNTREEIIIKAFMAENKVFVEIIELAAG